ncbi:hypothetical protein HYH03_003481 [Edaphochlamys debaryana]|uniref:Uncharacterized protein n=1 Tax=Edaphochlamys debaryana TaxID=47281 RepID=A0A835YBZ3_9CHLO|nr:hypothetical protein HYH03_003481 [Edaphochlamys debaryana]|eukprot:KAG2498742.1 hypothetical protein HYH03_003481 [Edaphochlamys debaryana]
MESGMNGGGDGACRGDLTFRHGDAVPSPATAAPRAGSSPQASPAHVLDAFSSQFMSVMSVWKGPGQPAPNLPSPQLSPNAWTDSCLDPLANNILSSVNGEGGWGDVGAFSSLSARDFQRQQRQTSPLNGSPAGAILAAAASPALASNSQVASSVQSDARELLQDCDCPRLPLEPTPHSGQQQEGRSQPQHLALSSSPASAHAKRLVTARAALFAGLSSSGGRASSGHATASAAAAPRQPRPQRNHGISIRSSTLSRTTDDELCAVSSGPTGHERTREAGYDFAFPSAPPAAAGHRASFTPAGAAHPASALPAARSQPYQLPPPAALLSADSLTVTPPPSASVDSKPAVPTAPLPTQHAREPADEAPMLVDAQPPTGNGALVVSCDSPNACLTDAGRRRLSDLLAARQQLDGHFLAGLRVDTLLGCRTDGGSAVPESEDEVLRMAASARHPAAAGKGVAAHLRGSDSRRARHCTFGYAAGGKSGAHGSPQVMPANAAAAAAEAAALAAAAAAAAEAEAERRRASALSYIESRISGFGKASFSSLGLNGPLAAGYSALLEALDNDQQGEAAAPCPQLGSAELTSAQSAVGATGEAASGMSDRPAGKEHQGGVGSPDGGPTRGWRRLFLPFGCFGPK